MAGSCRLALRYDGRSPRSIYFGSTRSGSINQPVVAHLEVQVRARDVAVRAAESDHLALAHDLARLHVDVAQVRVERHIVGAVVDHHAEPVARWVPPRHDHLAPVRGPDVRPQRNRDVERGVAFMCALGDPPAHHRPDELPVAVGPVLVFRPAPLIRRPADRGPVGAGLGVGARTGQEDALLGRDQIGRCGEAVPRDRDDLLDGHLVGGGDPAQRVARAHGVAEIVERGHDDRLARR